MCSALRAPKEMAQGRIRRLQQAMQEAGLDAFAIHRTPDIEWLTAFRQVFDDEEAHIAFASPYRSDVLIHTDSRYVTAMEREAHDTVFAIDAETKAFSAWVHEAWEDLCAAYPGKACTLGIEDTITLSQYRALERAFMEKEASTQAKDVRPYPFKETSNVVLKLRAVKDDFEIRRMKAAQAATDAAFTHICEFMRPGMTEREVQLELDDFMLRQGAQSLAFQTIVATGENGASPHAVVSEKKLEAGQCVVMDFGARFEGYCSDMTRTVFLGAPEGDMLRAWECLRRANETVEALLKPGITGRDAHECALSVLEEGGFGGLMGHGLGHGVGIEIHEEPSLSPRNEAPLEAGNVVTVEPGIYVPGRFGMRLEDFGVIVNHGFEVFTQSTHDMVIV